MDGKCASARVSEWNNNRQKSTIFYYTFILEMTAEKSHTWRAKSKHFKNNCEFTLLSNKSVLNWAETSVSPIEMTSGFHHSQVTADQHQSFYW